MPVHMISTNIHPNPRPNPPATERVSIAMQNANPANTTSTPSVRSVSPARSPAKPAGIFGSKLSTSTSPINMNPVPTIMARIIPITIDTKIAASFAAK